MIIDKFYDEKTRTQKVWYDSTMLYYSEMVEDEYDNIGELYITFKNGTKYVYHKVKFEDYITLLSGGSDLSQGKTLNKVIKGKYDYEKCGESDMEKIKQELLEVQESKKVKKTTVFVCGSEDVTQNDFENHYYPAIMSCFDNVENVHFIVCGESELDKLAQDLIVGLSNNNGENVTVYCVGDKPKYLNEKITDVISGFDNKEDMNNEMMKNSSHLIAFVKSTDKLDMTAKNILSQYLILSF